MKEIGNMFYFIHMQHTGISFSHSRHLWFLFFISVPPVLISPFYNFPTPLYSAQQLHVHGYNMGLCQTVSQYSTCSPHVHFVRPAYLPRNCGHIMKVVLGKMEK